MNKYVLSGLSGLAAGIILALIAMNVITPPAAAINDNPSIGVLLTIDVYGPDGSLKQHYVKEGDLLLKNWIALQQYWFMYNPDSNTGINPKNTGGTVGDCSYWQTNGNSGYKADIVLGNGTTSPAIDDYTLNNKLVTFDISSINIMTSGNDMNLSITGSWVADSSYNITEVGLEIRAYCGANAYPLLIFRDVLATPITLNAQDTISVTYTLMYDNP
jgi:hypothetical protein